jgi:hypothetical protein
LKRTTALSATTFRAPPPRDLGDVDGDAFALAVQGVQAGGEDGGAGDGVGALVEGAARVGGLAGDDQMVVAAALALARQSAVGQRGLIGHADVAACAPSFASSGSGGRRADLLVGDSSTVQPTLA